MKTLYLIQRGKFVETRENKTEISVDTVFRQDYLRALDNKVVGDEYFSIDI